MEDLAVGLGLVLVIEGLVWAINPAFGRRMLAMTAQMSDGMLARAGWVAIGLGAFVIWLIRG
ncbi:MAG: DUF2065 domain-containing protein [Hyphomicrobiaceae bacterium]